MSDEGIERRRGTGDIQRDLGRMESDIQSLTRRHDEATVVAQRDRDVLHQMAADHAQMDREDHAGLNVRITDVQAALAEKIDGVQSTLVGKIDALVLTQAEQKGGWRMLSLIGVGGGTIGGGIATLLGLFNSK